MHRNRPFYSSRRHIGLVKRAHTITRLGLTRRFFQTADLLTFHFFSCTFQCNFFLQNGSLIQHYGNLEPVEPLDYNPSFYQPMRETLTNRCHNILKPIWPRTTYAMIQWKLFQFAIHGNLLGGMTALKESDQNIRQFKNSQKWLIHVTSPYNIQTLSSKQIMIILKLIRQKLSWSYIKFS